MRTSRRARICTLFLPIALAAASRPARAVDQQQSPDPLPAPTPVTAKGEDLPLADAFSMVFSEGGFNLDGASRTLLSARDKPTTLALVERPFWSAVKELCDRNQVDVQEIQSDRAIRLRAAGAPPGAQPWAVNGPAVLLVNHIDARRTLNYMPNRFGPDTSCTMSLRTLTEGAFKPRLYRIEQVEATVTDANEPLEPHPAAGNTRFFPTSSWRQFAIVLRAPNTLNGKRIPKLAVTVRYVLDVQTKTLEIADILQAGGSEHVVGNFKFKVAEVLPAAEGRYKFTFELARNGRPAAEWRDFDDLVSQGPKVVDAQGRPLRQIGGSGGGNNDWRRYEQTLASDGALAGPPHKLVWEYPVSVKIIDVPFEFTDVPIP
jgi:hypothetical protein